ncbi:MULTISPECIES: hypothetical protein [unclassified Endozoicomonas]|uniref:hypothetical protein n=1 Tax=unclassified Endozoicomonas TaxID=2644528 RepID=UPI003BB6AA30
MQNVNSGATSSQLTGYVTPPVAVGRSPSPPVAAVASVPPTPGLSPELCLQEEKMSTNGTKPVTNRNVALSAPSAQRDEISKPFRDGGNPDTAGISSTNTEKRIISDMKDELIKLVGPLLWNNARICGLALTGKTRDQLKFKVTADYDCSPEEKRMLLAEIERFMQDNVPQRLRNEFKLVIDYIGPIEALSSGPVNS